MAEPKSTGSSLFWNMATVPTTPPQDLEDDEAFQTIDPDVGQEHVEDDHLQEMNHDRDSKVHHP